MQGKENGLDTSVSKPATGLNDFINQFTSEVLEPVPTKEELRKAELLKTAFKSKITLDSEFEKLEPILYFKDSLGNDIEFGSLGNFSTIQGKAKSKKTYFTSILCGAFLNPNDYTLGTFRSAVEDNKRNIIYFDTEMGNSHVQKVLKRIYKLSNLSKDVFSNRIDCIALRPCSALERCELIDTYLKEQNEQGKEFGLVVIDGIADLITNINDYEQGDKAGAYLLKWTALYNCHITTIIHENKGDDNARGHLGSTVINKGELPLRLEVNSTDTSISTMKILLDRNGLEHLGLEFSFKIVDEMPISLSKNDIPITKVGVQKRKSIRENFDLTTLYNLALNIFDQFPNGINRDTLIDKLQYQLESKGFDREFKTGKIELGKDLRYFTEDVKLFIKNGNNVKMLYFLNKDFNTQLI